MMMTMMMMRGGFGGCPLLWVEQPSSFVRPSEGIGL